MLKEKTLENGVSVKALSKLLDYQRFAGNGKLQAIIAQTETRLTAQQNQVSDDDLEWVAAAGEGPRKKMREQEHGC